MLCITINVEQFGHPDSFRSKTTSHSILVVSCSVFEEVFNLIHQQLRNYAPQFLSISEFIFEVLGFVGQLSFFLIGCARQHEYFQAAFTVVDVFDLLFVVFDVPDVELSISIHEFIGGDCLQKSIYLFHLKFKQLKQLPIGIGSFLNGK